MPGPRFHHHPDDHDGPEFPGGAGTFSQRDTPVARDYSTRAFTVGIGGPVGSGKTALLLALRRALRDSHSVAVVTNDIFTKEDAEFLVRNQALPPERIAAVETGGCPHTAVRDDMDGVRAGGAGLMPGAADIGGIGLDERDVLQVEWRRACGRIAVVERDQDGTDRLRAR